MISAPSRRSSSKTIWKFHEYHFTNKKEYFNVTNQTEDILGKYL